MAICNELILLCMQSIYQLKRPNHQLKTICCIATVVIATHQSYLSYIIAIKNFAYETAALFFCFCSPGFPGFCANSIKPKRRIVPKSNHQKFIGLVLLVGNCNYTHRFGYLLYHFWEDVFSRNKNVKGTGSAITGLT